MNGDDVVRSPSSRFRFRFSLLALLFFITLVALLLAWLVQPRRMVATALFQIDSAPPTVFGDAGNSATNEREFEIFKKTQLALLKSNFVLTAAVRNPSITPMQIFPEQTDAVEWLQDHLEIGFPENAEVLAISLHGTEAQSDDLVVLVDAVAKAYKDEVVNEQRQRRFATRDLLARNLENVNNEIKRKMDEYLDIARESGKPESGGVDLLQQLGAKRLERVEDEIMRLESQLAIDANGDAPKRKAIEERLSQLREQLSKLTNEVKSRMERSADLEVREQNLKQLQSIANEMSVKLEHMDIEASSPDRIKQVQPAVPARE